MQRIDNLAGQTAPEMVAFDENYFLTIASVHKQDIPKRICVECEIDAIFILMRCQSECFLHNLVRERRRARQITN